MPVPSVVQAPTTFNYVSSLSIAENLHKPEIDPEFVRRYGDQNLTGFLDMLGYSNPVGNIEFSHWEEDWLHERIRTLAQAGGGANATVVLTVQNVPTDFNYTYPGSAQAPYIVANNQTTSTPRINDIIQFPDRTLALVTDTDYTVNPNTFDATPLQSGDSIPATTTATEIVVIGNAHEEQSGQPLSRNGRVNRYVNNLMIKKSKHTVSGTEAGVQTWIEVEDQNGQSGYLWYFEGGYQEYRRFMNECEATMLLGQKVTNTVLATLFPTLTVTEGLIPFIENFGNQILYSSITGFTLGDLDNLVKTLDANRGSKENTIWAGINLSLDMDDVFNDFVKAGGASYGTFNNMEDLAISMQFASFKRGNYTFHKKTYDVFNYPQMLGAVGQEFPDYAIVIPTDNTEEAGTRQSVPSLRMNYLQGQGNNYSREVEEWLTGGANGVYTGEVDEININYRAQRGFEGFAPNRFAAIRKA